jgi:putative flippase GtrA
MDSPASTSSVQPFLQRPGIRQFVKFCIVGASSTLISMSIFSLLIYGLHLNTVLHNALAGQPALQALVDEYRLYIQLAAGIAFIFAVTNGYFWNSRWTFRQNDPARRKEQYGKFVAVNVIGLILNQIILFVVNRALTAGKVANEKGWEPLIAFGIATCIVVFWNFTANKLWTFKQDAS